MNPKWTLSYTDFVQQGHLVYDLLQDSLDHLLVEHRLLLAQVPQHVACLCFVLHQDDSVYCLENLHEGRNVKQLEILQVSYFILDQLHS